MGTRTVHCKSDLGSFEVRVGVNGAKVSRIPVPPQDANEALSTTGVPVVDEVEQPRIGGSVGQFGPYMANDGYVWENEDDVTKMLEYCRKISAAIGF